MRRLLDDGMVLFVALTDDGTISWVGDSSQVLLDRPADSMIGRHALEFIHPDDHGAVIATMLEDARGADERILLAIRVAHADGRWLSLEFGGFDLRQPDGSGLFLVWGRSHESTAILLTFLNSLLAGSDLGHLLSQVARWLDDTMPGGRTAVLVSDGDRDFRCRAASTELPRPLAGDVILDQVAADDWLDEIRSTTLAELEVFGGLPDGAAEAARQGGYDALWTVPVRAPGSAEPLALVVVWRTRPGALLATHRRQLETAAQTVRLAIEWSSSQQQLVVAATTDSLTGLVNRAGFDAALAADRSPLTAVLYADLDDFKRVNDRYGHLVGDRILHEAARRLSNAVRPGDVLARLGGDEFAVLCPDLHDAGEAERVAASMVATLDVAMQIDGRKHHVGCSVGIATTHTTDRSPTMTADLLRAADRALYRAKAAGKSRWALAGDAEPTLPFPG